MRCAFEALDVQCSRDDGVTLTNSEGRGHDLLQAGVMPSSASAAGAVSASPSSTDNVALRRGCWSSADESWGSVWCPASSSLIESLPGIDAYADNQGFNGIILWLNLHFHKTSKQLIQVHCNPLTAIRAIPCGHQKHSESPNPQVLVETDACRQPDRRRTASAIHRNQPQVHLRPESIPRLTAPAPTVSATSHAEDPASAACPVRDEPGNN